MGAEGSRPVDEELGSFVPDRRPRHKALRVFCLHGYGANNDITLMQI